VKRPVNNRTTMEDWTEDNAIRRRAAKRVQAVYQRGPGEGVPTATDGQGQNAKKKEARCLGVLIGGRAARLLLGGEERGAPA